MTGPFAVAIVGSGPAGASCAALCAQAGLRTLLLERENFPREKVCGDCLNPACLPVLEKLGVAGRFATLPHGTLRQVDFIAIGGQTSTVTFPGKGEIALKRSLLDQMLLERAQILGAEIRQGTSVTALTPPSRPDDGWKIQTGDTTVSARVLVAADGRNSTVARLLNLLPRGGRERVALQTHLPLPAGFGNRVVLQFLPEGYSGQAPVGNNELNLCLVGKPGDMPALRAWAEATFQVARAHVWRTITPLRRAAIAPARRALFLVGDAARVVEPFTGEGIYYALRSGELAARQICRLLENGDAAGARQAYTAAHAELYRGRLWINRLARTAVLSPRISSALLRRGLLPASLLSALTTKIVR